MWEWYIAFPYYLVLFVLVVLGVRLFLASKKQMKGPKNNEG